MLRLRDGGSGSYAELAANPSVPLRVCAHPPSSGLTGLRVVGSLVYWRPDGAVQRNSAEGS